MYFITQKAFLISDKPLFIYGLLIQQKSYQSIGNKENHESFVTNCKIIDNTNRSPIKQNFVSLKDSKSMCNIDIVITCFK